MKSPKETQTRNRWYSQGEFVCTGKRAEGFITCDTVHAQFAARKHNEVVVKLKEMLGEAWQVGACHQQPTYEQLTKWRKAINS